MYCLVLWNSLSVYKSILICMPTFLLFASHCLCVNLSAMYTYLFIYLSVSCFSCYLVLAYRSVCLIYYLLVCLRCLIAYLFSSAYIPSSRLRFWLPAFLLVCLFACLLVSLYICLAVCLSSIKISLRHLLVRATTWHLEQVSSPTSAARQKLQVK